MKNPWMRLSVADYEAVARAAHSISQIRPFQMAELVDLLTNMLEGLWDFERRRYGKCKVPPHSLALTIADCVWADKIDSLFGDAPVAVGPRDEVEPDDNDRKFLELLRRVRDDAGVDKRADDEQRD